MSRSGYSDGCDGLELGRWRARVASATRGHRGQQFFRDLIAALDAMPEKVLIAEELVDERGDVCAIGSLGKARGVDMSKLDPEDRDGVAAAFNIAMPLACEVVYMNDEGGWQETPQHRWKRMRIWAERQLRRTAPTPADPPTPTKDSKGE